MADDDTAAKVLHPTGEQLRALAHPLRTRLLGALRFHGPATATALAARLGTNSGATSYHLRQLAAAGLIEDDRSRSSGRDRWWRAAHESTAWISTDFDDDPDARAAEDWLVRHHARRAAEWMADWLDARQDWSAEWRAAAEHSDYHLDLTPDGLRELMEDLHAVVRHHRARAAADTPNTERVTLLLQSFPSPERTA